MPSRQPFQGNSVDAMFADPRSFPPSQQPRSDVDKMFALSGHASPFPNPHAPPPQPQPAVGPAEDTGGVLAFFASLFGGGPEPTDIKTPVSTLIQQMNEARNAGDMTRMREIRNQIENRSSGSQPRKAGQGQEGPTAPQIQRTLNPFDDVSRVLGRGR